MSDTEQLPIGDKMLSVVVPAYNESARVGSSIERILEFLGRATTNWEVILVDDGSTDLTVDVAEAAAAGNTRFKVIKAPQNEGKGSAVRRGVLAATGDYILFSDADLSTPIEESHKLVGALVEGYDVAIGSREHAQSSIDEHQPWYRERMGKTFNFLVRILLTNAWRDTQCGFKAFTREAGQALFQMQRVKRFCFDAEILFIALKHGYRVSESPIHWLNAEGSRVSLIGDPLNMIFDLFRIRLNDMLGRYRRPSPCGDGT